MKLKLFITGLITFVFLSGCILIEKDSIIYGATLTGELAFDSTQSEYLTIYNKTGENIDSVYIVETAYQSSEPSSWGSNKGTLDKDDFRGFSLTNYTPGKTIWVKCVITGNKSGDVKETDKYLIAAFQFEADDSWNLYVNKANSAK